jgi:hypothetical protein
MTIGVCPDYVSQKVYDSFENFDFTSCINKILQEKEAEKKKNMEKKTTQQTSYYKTGSNVNVYYGISNHGVWYSASIGLP